jgi:SAM-dependent methyltransferase
MGTKQTEGEQQALWNAAGQAWVEAQSLIDELFRPIEALLVDAAGLGPGGRVLDVGCGTGGTTLAIARRLGKEARCTGVDISGPMLAAARARSEREGVPATFICADAQTWAFAPASFDTIVSRFGVMFFDDFVRAFANLRRAAADGGVLRCVTWRSAEENPFMTTAERAAAPLLPDMPPRDPHAPGQFALADRARVTGIVKKSGWSDIELRPLDVDCSFPEKELVGYLTRFGPVGRALDGIDEGTRTRVLAAVRPAFDRYVQGTNVRFTAACWMLSARA